jgi:hypothetical protein
MWWILITLVILITISYQDFKTRSINIFLFFILAILLVYSALRNAPLSVVAAFTGLNFLYVILVMLLCSFYLYIRYKSVAIFKFLGVGDVIFFLVVAFWFNPIQFILFNTVTFIGALALHFFFLKLSKAYNKFSSVPLAGFQSMSLAVMIVYAKII